MVIDGAEAIALPSGLICTCTSPLLSPAPFPATEGAGEADPSPAGFDPCNAACFSSTPALNVVPPTRAAAGFGLFRRGANFRDEEKPADARGAAGLGVKAIGRQLRMGEA